MDIRKIVKKVYDDLSTNLNTHIASCQAVGENWFKELTFSEDAPRVENDRYFMGIYLSSPEGQVYTGSEKAQTVTITLDCILDDIRTNSNLPTYYLSAVIDYLTKKTYETSSVVTAAQIIRTDLDAPANMFAVAISITSHVHDYDMGYDIY